MCKDFCLLYTPLPQNTQRSSEVSFLILGKRRKDEGARSLQSPSKTGRLTELEMTKISQRNTHIFVPILGLSVQFSPVLLLSLVNDANS